MISIELGIILCVLSFMLGMAWQAQRTKDRLTTMKIDDMLYNPHTGIQEKFHCVYRKIVP